MAISSPRRRRRGSIVSSMPGRLTTTQSIRGRMGASHLPSTRMYVGRLDVENKPSGNTPSAGKGANRASGAPLNGGWSKSGNRFLDEVMWERKLGVAQGGFKRRTCDVRARLTLA